MKIVAFISLLILVTFSTCQDQDLETPVTSDITVL